MEIKREDVYEIYDRFIDFYKKMHIHCGFKDDHHFGEHHDTRYLIRDYLFDDKDSKFNSDFRENTISIMTSFLDDGYAYYCTLNIHQDRLKFGINMGFTEFDEFTLYETNLPYKNLLENMDYILPMFFDMVEKNIDSALTRINFIRDIKNPDNIKANDRNKSIENLLT